MRIAYDHQIFCSQKFGGISRYFFELARRLDGADNGAVECHVNSPLYINDYLKDFRHQLKVFGVVAPTARGVSRIYRPLGSYLSPLGFLGWNPDIVHETYYSHKTIAPPGSRIVVTVYDMIHELYPEYFSARDRTRDFKKVAVERADHVICISENSRRDLVQLLGVPLEKTTVIHLGFSLSRVSFPAPYVTRRPFILYVGSRGGYKNFERLLAAYACRRELRDNYDLVAFGGGSFNRHEVERIRRLNLREEQVRQIGGGDGVLAALYKQAAMFVYPSLYEGFGIPPLEAMSFDCPVACSNMSSIPEVVGDAAAQFDPLNVDSIAAVLINLATDSVLRTTLIDCGRARVGQFSWDKCAVQTLDVYRDLMQ